MSWATAIPTKTLKPKATAPLAPPIVIETAKIDWDRLVSLDFETYYDEQYTLKKLSTSEYVRDERFEALMLGLKVGRKKTRIIPGPKIKAELAKINWKTHSLLAHNVQFDGFILSTHYGIVPAKYYDTLGMARGLHSNEVGADLDSVSIFYGGAGKTESGTEDFKGLRFKDLFADKTKWNNASVYCANDVDEMYRIFTEMVPHYPADEIDLIHMTARMFCDPVLKVDIPRVQAEYDREVAHRKQLMLGSVDLSKYDIKDLLKKKAERELPDEERQMLMVKRVIGSNERFTQLLIDAGVPEDAIPRKVSPAWIKRSPAEKEATLDEKYVYAYAKDDLDFTSLPDRVWDIRTDLDPNDVNDVIKADAMAVRWQQLIDVRISVKSTTNITRAARFLEAGRDGYSLPVGYAYYRAHCLTGDAQVLTRSGWVALADWQGGDIAQWSPGGAIKFAPATANSFEVHEDLLQADSRYHGCTYTKGHTLPTLTSCGNFKARKAGEALTTRFDIPISGVLDGTADITPLQAQLAVMVQADGNVRSYIPQGQCVRFGFSKPRKIERCKTLLSQAGIKFTEAWENNVCRIRVGATHYAQLIQLVGPYKQFDKDLWDAPAETKEAFISELAHWDGDVEPQPNGFTYSTTDHYNAQFVATMAHLSGRAAFVSTRKRDEDWADSYRVYIRKETKTRSEPKHYEEVPFKGTVYCPTTETGYFMVRQRGRIVVTGNTGRWGGNNKMNMQNLTRGGELRLSILAAPGHQIAVADSSQIEARTNAWLWDQMDLIAAFRDKRDIYSEFATAVYGRLITKGDKIERHVGKTCLAASTRVLTNRGLLSIIDVRSTDLLWDGVEWVKHDGLIYQGHKETQVHKGLEATGDHEILTARGWQEWSEVRTNHSLFQSALCLATLPSCGGTTGPAPTENSKATALYAGANAVTSPWSQQETCGPAEQQDATYARRRRRQSNGTGPTNTCSPTIATELGYSTGFPLPSPGAQTRKTQLFTTMVGAASQYVMNGATTVQRFLHTCKHYLAGTTRALNLIGSTTTAVTAQAMCGLLPSLSTPPTSDGSPTSNKESASSKRKTHVYDLVNAGPRNRFTVMTDDGPVIVHNCVLGLGYQMGAAKLQMTLAKGALGGPKIALPIDECHRIVNLYRRQNYKISAGWQKCAEWIEHMANPNLEPIRYKCLEIGYQYIQLPNGMRLKYPDLRKARGDKGWDEWSYQSGEIRKKIYGGLLCENLVQALARIIVATQMLAIDTKYRVVMTTHDEAVTHPKTKDAAKCFAWMEKCMTTPPAWCADLPVMCEGGWDTNYSK